MRRRKRKGPRLLQERLELDVVEAAALPLRCCRRVAFDIGLLSIVKRM